MKPQATLRFASCFAVNLAASLHAASSVIQFAAGSFTVAENVGQATITVQRTEDLDAPANVDYASTNLTAIAGVDYIKVTGVLTFAAGENIKTFTISVHDDPLVNGDRTVKLLLRDPAGGATLGHLGTATLRILDNEKPVFVDPSFKPNITGGRYAVAVQSDGKILVVGDASPGIVRLNTNGTTDVTFNPGTVADNVVFDLAVQPDNKIVIGGWFSHLPDIARSGVARLNSDGSLDTSFKPPQRISYVETLALQPDGKVLVGGQDTNNLFNFSRLNPDGSLDGSFTSTLTSSGPLEAILVQPDGKILIGGTFLNGNIARLNPNGTVDSSFQAYASDTVWSLALQRDGKVLVGGSFWLVNGVNRNGIARLNRDGSLDAGFNAGEENGSLRSVLSLAIDADNSIFVSLNSGLAQLNPDGSLHQSFWPLVNGRIWAAALQPDGRLVIAGQFNAALGPVVVSGVMRLFTRDSGLHGFELSSTSRNQFLGGPPPIPISVTASETSGSAELVVDRLGETSGTLSVDYSTSASGSAAATPGLDYVSVSGTLVFGPLETSKTISIPILNDDLVEGSETFRLTLTGASAGAQLDVGPITADITIEDNDRGVELDDRSEAFVQFSYDFPVSERAGAVSLTVRRDEDNAAKTITVPYALIAGSAKAGIDYLGERGQITFGVGETNKTISVPIFDDHGLVRADRQFTLTLESPIGGAQVGEQHSATIAVIDAERPGSLDLSFAPPLISLGLKPRPPLVVIQPDQKIIVAGYFIDLVGYQNHVIRLNPDGSLDKSFELFRDAALNPEFFQWVSGLALQADGKILVGGGLFELPDGAIAHLVRLNSDGSIDPTFIIDPLADSLDNSVRSGAITLQPDSKILVALAGVPLLRLNQDGSTDATFAAPPISVGTNGTPSLTVIAVQPDGKIVIGGLFDAIAGVSRSGIARLTPAGTLDKSFDPGIGIHIVDEWTWPVTALALLPNGQVLVAGRFDSFNGIPRHSLARLNADGSLDASFNPDFRIAASTLSALAVQPDGRILVASEGEPIGPLGDNQIARLNPDGSLDPAFDPGLLSMTRDFFRVTSIAALQADGKVVIGVAWRGLLRLNGDPPLRFLGLDRVANSQVRLTLANRTGKPVVLQASGNLIDWISLTTNAPDVTTIEFAEPVLLDRTQRFFRALSQ